MASVVVAAGQNPSADGMGFRHDKMPMPVAGTGNGSRLGMFHDQRVSDIEAEFLGQH
nr:hypothetical protein [Paradevosia shaoguanensis]